MKNTCVLPLEPANSSTFSLGRRLLWYRTATVKFQCRSQYLQHGQCIMCILILVFTLLCPVVCFKTFWCKRGMDYKYPHESSKIKSLVHVFQSDTRIDEADNVEYVIL